MQNSGPIEDRFLIRELYGRYALTGSHGDTEGWLACWDEECHWLTMNFDRHGKAELREQNDQLWENFVSAVVLNEVGPIAVSGDNATGSCAVLEIITLKSGGTLWIAGLYSDEFVRTGGEWLFRTRDYKLVTQEVRPEVAEEAKP